MRTGFSLALLALAATTALSTTTAARACEPPVIVIGASGQPEYISPEQNRTAEMEGLFGPAPDPEAMLVVDTRSRTGWWVPKGSDLGPVDVALTLGADTTHGFVYSGPDHCAPPDVPIDTGLREGPRVPGGGTDLFVPGDPGRAPEELFPAPEAGGLQPRPGLWQARLGETRLEGCPAMMAQAFAQSPGALPAEWLKPRALDFTPPFHPDQLEMSRTLAGEGMGAVRWSAVGQRTWQAEVMPQIFGQIPAGEGGGSKMVWTLSVVAEDRIDHSVLVDIVLPAAAAQVLGGNGCKMISNNQWIRVGD